MQQTIRCPSCGSPNMVGQKFCGSCGAQLGNVCPNCGASLNPNDKFCGNCGAQLPATGTPLQTGYQPQPTIQPQNFYNPETQRQQYWGQQPGWEPSQATQYATPTRGMPYQGAYGPVMPRRQSSTPLVILLIVLILFLGGFTWAAFWGPLAGGGAGTSSALQITKGPFVDAKSDTTAETRDLTIIWETSVNSIGKVEYGTSNSYGSSSSWETDYVKSHSIKLTGLTPNTRYHYRIVLKDQKNNEVTSSDYTVKTPQ